MSELLKVLNIPKVSRKEAYKYGYDCGINGVNETNCHFSIFSSKENTKAWEEGRVAALADKTVALAAKEHKK